MSVSPVPPPWWRVVTHPAVWSVPLMALAVRSTAGFNRGFYEYFVNGDPQGDAQQAEWQYATHVFTYTSGVLVGQLLSVVVGMELARRHRHGFALTLSVALSALLAGVTVAVGRPLVEPVGRLAAGLPVDHAEPGRVLLTEVAAYPLYAAIGVGLGVLLWRLPGGWNRPVLVALALGWIVGTATGLLQNDTFAAPAWLLGLPPVAGSAAVALAALSVTDRSDDVAVVVGDLGHHAGVALLVGAAAWAVALNLLPLLGLRQRRRQTSASRA
jgi:hypothetical protein